MLSTDLEIRLAALEAEVALLKRLLPAVSETPWWEKIVALRYLVWFDREA